MSALPLDPKHRRKTVYRPDPFGRVGQGDFVEKRDPWGRMPDLDIKGLSGPEPKGPPPVLDDPWENFPGHVFLPPYSTPPILGRPVGRTGANAPDDVAAVEWLLGQGDYLDLGKTDGPTGYFGLRLEDAIRRFQADHGLKVDGALLPARRWQVCIRRCPPLP